MGDFYAGTPRSVHTYGRVILQASGSIGGSKHVFWEWGGYKNHLHTSNFGGTLKNPFKGDAKIFAGDLMWIKTNDKAEEPEIYLLKIYKVKSAASTVIKIYRDGYKHIPFVGDVLMEAPDEIGATGGQASVVTKVVESVDGSDEVWEVTVDTEITGLTDGDVLVEAEGDTQTATGTMLVKNINAVSPDDNDFFLSPYKATSSQKMDAAYINFSPVLGGIMYKHKMSPIPACVEKLNKSRINGLYEV